MFSGCWRALAKGAVWAFFVSCNSPSSLVLVVKEKITAARCHGARAAHKKHAWWRRGELRARKVCERSLRLCFCFLNYTSHLHQVTTPLWCWMPCPSFSFLVPVAHSVLPRSSVLRPRILIRRGAMEGGAAGTIVLVILELTWHRSAHRARFPSRRLLVPAASLLFPRRRGHSLAPAAARRSPLPSWWCRQLRSATKCSSIGLATLNVGDGSRPPSGPFQSARWLRARPPLLLHLPAADLAAASHSRTAAYFSASRLRR